MLLICRKKASIEDRVLKVAQDQKMGKGGPSIMIIWYLQALEMVAAKLV